jgi:hypothetical protein
VSWYVESLAVVFEVSVPLAIAPSTPRARELLVDWA